MARSNLSPALFDITADIAGEIPLDLIKQWADSDLTLKSQTKLLSPFTIKGTVVCSDSAGLSKLSGERGLIEVMKLISEPKEVIHNLGKTVGGKAVGTWFADNTEMIYNSDINIDDLLSHLASAQKEIAKLTVQVGMSVHTGEFIEIGSGLYGHDADFAENLAESYTAGGEIVVTEKSLVNSAFKPHLILREDLKMPHKVFSLKYENLKQNAVKSQGELYPIPFNQEFYTDLYSASVDIIEEKYTKDKIVVLIHVEHLDDELLLNKLSDLTLANYYLQQTVSQYKLTTIKSNGALGIYITDDPEAAIEFARDVQEILEQNDFGCTIGVSKGSVLLFDLENGSKEIAGNPVNIASKLAEDFGKTGSVYIHDSVEMPKKFESAADKFDTEISRVNIKGWII